MGIQYTVQNYDPLHVMSQWGQCIPLWTCWRMTKGGVSGKKCKGSIVAAVTTDHFFV